VKPILKNLTLVAFGLVGLILVAAALDWLLFRGLELGAVEVPRPQDVRTKALDQGWSPKLSHDYHYTSQGTKILPKAWFLALEEPSVDPFFTGAKLASREYLSRFGFIYEPDAKPDDLPIGFATGVWDTDVDYVVPKIQRKTEMVGLTCAACHTGRLDFDLRDNKRLGVIIEGGSAMINLSKFQEAVGQALFWTQWWRGEAFAKRVKELGDDREASEILKDLNVYIETGIAGRDYAREHKLNVVDAGFARTDALGLIGNRVFGPLDDENQSVTDAPVNFPHVWDTAWFDWVQYNASIRMPLARNFGEALGVGAAVKLGRTIDERYSTTVRIDDLKWMEDVLGGDEPFAPWSPGAEYKGGLRPPRWDDLRDIVAKAGGLADRDAEAAMTIDDDLRKQGAGLYTHHCQRCHLPPTDVLRTDWAGDELKYWVKDARSGRKFLNLRVIDLNEIGTDPNQAVNFYRRFAVMPNPRHGRSGYRRETDTREQFAPGYPRSSTTETVSAEEGLYRVTSILREQFFRDNHLFSPANRDRRLAIDRFRTLPIDGEEDEILLDTTLQIVDGAAIEDVIRANLGYKARPLDGIWATPPYLHNGSVPNLDQVLMPAERRSGKFYLGSTRFDPVRVGYHTEQLAGAFLMDTTIAGNHNTGHEFRNFTLEEFEAALLNDSDRATVARTRSKAERWAAVLGDGSEGLDDLARWKLMREKTREILEKVRNGVRDGIRNPKFLGVRGVLDPEFEPRERRALIAYLKSL
jgi:hypothetical protein